MLRLNQNNLNINLNKEITSLVNTMGEIREYPKPPPENTVFLAPQLIQTTLPHKDPFLLPKWERKNGRLTLRVMPSDTEEKIDKTGRITGEIGGKYTYHVYPYGSKPRLMHIWVNTEAVRTKNRLLYTGNSLNEFMVNIGIGKQTGGGRTSPRRYFKDQLLRYSHAKITFLFDSKNRQQGKNVNIVDEYDYW